MCFAITAFSSNPTVVRSRFCDKGVYALSETGLLMTLPLMSNEDLSVLYAKDFNAQFHQERGDDAVVTPKEENRAAEQAELLRRAVPTLREETGLRIAEAGSPGENLCVPSATPRCTGARFPGSASAGGTLV